MLLSQYLRDNKLWVDWANSHLDWLKQQSDILKDHQIFLAGSRWFQLAHPDSDIEFVIILDNDDTKPLTEIAKIYGELQLGQKLSISKTKKGLWILELNDIDQHFCYKDYLKTKKKKAKSSFPVVKEKTLGQLNKRLPHKIEFIIMNRKIRQNTVETVEKFTNSLNPIQKNIYILRMSIAFKANDIKTMKNLKKWQKEIKND